MNEEYRALDAPDESGYRSKPQLRELAAHLQFHAGNLQRAGHTPAEVRQFLLGYAACFLDADPEQSANEASLPTGVVRSKNGLRFVAQVYCPTTKRSVRAGTFDTVEEAHRAHKAKHIELYGEHSPYFGEIAA